METSVCHFNSFKVLSICDYHQCPYHTQQNLEGSYLCQAMSEVAADNKSDTVNLKKKRKKEEVK